MIDHADTILSRIMREIQLEREHDTEEMASESECCSDSSYAADSVAHP